MTGIFRVDDVVDIVIRGAVVDHHGDHTLLVTVPGVDEQITIPIVADNGHPMRQVTVTRADIISAAPSPVAPIPAGPDLAGGGRNLYAAVNLAIDALGLPRPNAMGHGNYGRYLRLRDEGDRAAWVKALGFTGNHGVWGDGEITLLVSVDPDNLGTDYLTDPAARIAAVRETAPEFVVPVVEGGEQL